MKTQHRKAEIGNRPASRLERDYCRHALQNLGDDHIARLIRSTPSGAEDPYEPIVVTDFSTVGDASILLLPHGQHLVPMQVLEQPRWFIGMDTSALASSIVSQPAQKQSVLIFDDAPAREVPNLDAVTTSELRIAPVYGSKFTNLRIDAPEPTVMEMVFSAGDTRSTHLFDCECSDRIEVRDVAAPALWYGRSWAIDAYGDSERRAVDPVMRAIDTIGELGTKAINRLFNLDGKTASKPKLQRHWFYM